MQSIAAQASARMNGKPKKGKGKKSQPNGHAEPTMNGHLSKQTKQQRPKPQRTLAGALFSTSARLLLWYTILTALFRCPSSPLDLTDASPALCKPYLSFRSHATPYLEPHYNRYVAPYVDNARPYVDRFNNQVYTPASRFAKENYVKYGAPSVEQLQIAAQNRWDSTLRPQIEAAQAKAKSQYDASLGPHVQKVSDTVTPYYSKASKVASDTYRTAILPSYHAALPYGKQAWEHGHHITVHIVFPYVRWSEASARHFFMRTVWPRLRILYGDNVEPQLMRISERLGRYKEGKKLESIVESVDSSTNISSPPHSEVAPSSTVDEPVAVSTESQSHSDKVNETKESKDTKQSLSPEEVREQISSDLKTWQEKFAKAADKGSDDLEEQVKEITAKQIKSQARGVGPALIIELEESAAAALRNVKASIIAHVKQLPEDASDADLEAAHEAAVKDMTTPSLTVKDKAMAVRSWKQKYDEETHNLIKAASDSTLDVIDNIRDLGLQEIGMRWAWMDGVTYKDWQKYHDLKQTFDEWRDEVQARAMEHKGFVQAREAGEEVQSKAMDISMSTVKEIVRLKDVAKWKIWAEDTSDDFSTKAVPPRVAKVAKEAVEKATGAPSSIVNSAKDSFDSAKSIASEKVDDATSSVSSVASDIKKEVPKAAQSVVSAAKFKAEQVQEKIQGTPAPPAESLASKASSSLKSAASAASSVVEEPKKVWGGAAAFFVEAREPIFDEELDGASSVAESLAAEAKSTYKAASGAVESLATEAQSSYAAATSAAFDQYNIAKSVLSKQMLGTTKPVHEKMLSSIESAYSGAITAASERYQQALSYTGTIKSAVVGPTPGVLDSISAIAQSRLSDGLSLASAQYTKARAAVGAEPTPAHQQYLAEAQRQYYQAVGIAHARYAEFVDAASTAVYGTPTPVYQSIVDKAQSVASEASSSIIGSETPWHESIASQASQNWEALVTKASEQVYGQPTPFTASILGRAGDYGAQATDGAASQYSAVQSLLSELLVGKEPDFTESVMLRLSSAYHTGYPAVASSASSILADSYASASSVVTGVFTPPPAVENIIDQASEQINAALDAVSVQIYGTKKSNYEKASESAASAYSAASSKASEYAYGTQTGYAEAAQSSFASIASNAQAALSQAIYGTPAPSGAAAVASGAASAYSSIASQMSENYEDARAQVSKAVYGPEQGALESAQSRIAKAVESARSRIAEMGTVSGEKVEEVISSVSSVVSEAADAAKSNVAAGASSVSSAVSSATARAKDEL